MQLMAGSRIVDRIAPENTEEEEEGRRGDLYALYIPRRKLNLNHESVHMPSGHHRPRPQQQQQYCLLLGIVKFKWCHCSAILPCWQEVIYYIYIYCMYINCQLQPWPPSTALWWWKYPRYFLLLLLDLSGVQSSSFKFINNYRWARWVLNNSQQRFPDIRYWYICIYS